MIPGAQAQVRARNTLASLTHHLVLWSCSKPSFLILHMKNLLQELQQFHLIRKTHGKKITLNTDSNIPSAVGACVPRYIRMLRCKRVQPLPSTFNDIPSNSPNSPGDIWDISQSLRTCTQPGKINGDCCLSQATFPQCETRLTRTVHLNIPILQREDFRFHT